MRGSQRRNLHKQNLDTQSVRLSSGLIATLDESRHEPGAWVLTVDGTPQSLVYREEPENLSFDYIRRIAHMIDLVAEVNAPITALHLGGGALTLPRYLEASRPKSRQQVIELEAGLVELVRRVLPLPPGASIRVRVGDARELLLRLPVGLHGAVDLAVVDIFQGAQTPAQVTSAEFYALLRPLLSGRGMLAVNVSDGNSLSFARAQVATVQSLFAHTAIAIDTSLLKGRRFGNVVVYASAAVLPEAELRQRLSSGHTPAKLIAGVELKQFIAGAAVVYDINAVPSPEPSKNVFLAERS